MDKQPVVAGETFEITCPVAGYPIDSVIWEKGKKNFNFCFQFNHLNWAFISLTADNRVLPINRRQRVYPNGTLVIENVQRASDQGGITF